MIRENTFVEAMKAVKARNAELVQKENAKIEKFEQQRKAFYEKYYDIKDSREAREREQAKILEGCRDNNFATAIKGIYLTALEAATLTDDAIILAEAIVDNWIKEQGGASKIIRECKDKTYLLNRICTVVEEASMRDLQTIIEAEEKDEDEEVTKKVEGDEDEPKDKKEDKKDKEDKKAEDEAPEEKKDAEKEDETLDLIDDEDEEEDSDDDDKEESKEEDKEDKDDDKKEDKVDSEDIDKEAKDKAEEDEKEVKEPSDAEKNDVDLLDDGDDSTDEETKDNLPTQSEDEAGSDDSAEATASDTEPEESEEIEDSDDNSEEEVDVEVKDDDTADLIDDEEEEDSADPEDQDADGIEDDIEDDIETEVPEEETNDNEVLKDLDQEEDVQKAVAVIRQRVADAEETFIKNNAKDKEQINDLIEKISNNVKTVEDMADQDKEDNQDAVNQESVRMAKRKINDITNNRPLTLFEKFTREVSRNTMKDQNKLDSYLTESGSFDTSSVVETSKVMYGFLETLNTLQLAKVDTKYISELIETL